VGELENTFIDIAVSIVGAAVMALIGFVWRISHKASDIEKRVENVRELHINDMRQAQKDIDYLINKVDKNNDKMYSIVKNLKE